jgi:hypothetical protein
VSANAASLQGYSVDASDQAALRKAIDLALDYRGDVTITTTRSSPRAIEGYVFDRREDGALGVCVRVIPRDGAPRMTIPLADITRIEFTGKDTASGKSFETWVKKYIEKKTAGECASIESESLD